MNKIAWILQDSLSLELDFSKSKKKKKKKKDLDELVAEEDKEKEQMDKEHGSVVWIMFINLVVYLLLNTFCEVFRNLKIVELQSIVTSVLTLWL